MHPRSLDENTIILAGKLTHMISLHITRLFREKGYPVTVEQFTVLTVLWYSNGIPQKRIAESLNRDKTSITRIIDNMIKENLVVRIPSEKDKRIKLIYLTHKGKTLQSELVASSGKVYMQAMERLRKSELDTTNKALTKMIQNLT